MTDLESYRENIVSKITNTMESADRQPVLLVGAGLSIRYFSGPTWDQLLEIATDICQTLEQDYGYYRQTRSPQEMGQFLAEQYATWAWDIQTPAFSEKSLKHSKNKNFYLKSMVSRYFKSITPSQSDELTDDMVDGNLTAKEAQHEIELLKQMKPHAVITTNYDKFIENILNEDKTESELGYDVIVGQEILKQQHKSIGEVIKIHGGVSNPESLVLTSKDYSEFNSKRRYLSSKMLAYFVEHPLLIIGYRPGDPNIRKIFSWVDQTIPENKEMASDIFFVEFERNISERGELPEKKKIQIGSNGDITVNRIVAEEFSWIFNAFTQHNISNIPIGVLRRILASTVDVVSQTTPDREVVNVQKIENLAADKDELATVLGIAPDPSSNIEFNHDIRVAQMAEILGYDWEDTYKVNELIDDIEEETGVDIREFQNKYHVAFFTEDSPTPRRYSEEAIPLLKKVRDGEEFELDIPKHRIPDEMLED